MEILYKTLPEDKCPRGFQYKLNKWFVEPDFEGICKKGFHGSRNILYAMDYVTPGYVAKCEVRGESDIDDVKEAWSEIRIIKWRKWTKKDSVALAIYAAELVIENYEKEYPKDKRPREAIEAAKAVLKSDTEKNRSAAWSAAWSAWSAAESARSAAESARSAAWSAWSAAESAELAWSAESARSAAESAAESAELARSAARSAAWSAAESAASDEILKKCHDFVIKRKGL